MAGDIFTLDENNNAAVRTVGVNGIVESNKPDIFTEDENGNAAIRVVGSGGVDENKIIVKSDTIPEASADELGKFYCYSGATNATYTHGYVYECVEGSSYYVANIAFEQSTFASESFEKAGQLIVDAGVTDPTQVTGGTMTYALAGNLWTIVFTDENGNALNTGYSIYTDDLEQDYDILPVIDPSDFVDGQVVNMTINNVSEEQGYLWERIDLQPAAKLGRYLSGWNCATGLAATNPPESPYEYTTGDYFIVSAVATGGGTNYRPIGSSYVIGQASTTVETNSVVVNDTYLYDGTNWTLLKTGSTVTSVNGQTGDVTITESDILPSQTSNSGKFLTTDGTNASWSDKPLVNVATGGSSVITGGAFDNATTYNVSIGKNATSSGSSTSIGYNAKASRRCVALGASAEATATGTLNDYSIAIGLSAKATATGSIQINTGTNSVANTFKVSNANGNFEIMSADGTIPEARLADTTGATAGQALVLDSNLNAVWTDVDSLPSQTGNAGKALFTDGTDASWGSVSSNTTGTVLANSWVLDVNDNKYKQTVNVTGVTATNDVFVSPFASDSTEWGNCGVIGAAQASGTITFWADAEPTNDLQFTATILA